MKLSIIIPVHNEEENIVNTIKKIKDALDLANELVVVNDHSDDRTRELVEIEAAQYPDLRVVDNNLEKGFANAIKTGFANAQSDVVIPVMGDLCDDLDTLKRMFAKINEGYDIVCGCRYIKGGARLGGSKVKGFFSAFVGWSLHILLGLPTHDIANAFKMYRKSVLSSIDIKSKGFEISMEIPLKGYFNGFKMTEVPTVWKERKFGKSSFSMLKLLPAYLYLYLWAIVKRIKG